MLPLRPIYPLKYPRKFIEFLQFDMNFENESDCYTSTDTTRKLSEGKEESDTQGKRIKILNIN